MIRRCLQALVPLDWGPDQALRAVRLLRFAQDAIWAVHGEAMAEILGEIDPALEHLDEYIDLDAMDDPFDHEPPYTDLDDIPF